MKSILLIGQSNMAGRGALKDVAPIINENIYMLRNGRFQMMVEPLHNDRPNAGIGPAASFALAWTAYHPGESVGLIPCAEGGSAIDEWMPGTPLFRHAVSEARFALENGEISAVLWHQGENDSLNDLYLSYGEKLETIFHALRQELRLQDIPFLVGGLPDFLGQFGYGLYAPQYKEINQVLSDFAATHENCYFVPAESLTPNPDGIHIDADSQRAFGLRYYDVLAGTPKPMLSAEKAKERLAFLQNHPLTMKEQFMRDELAYFREEISFDELEKRHRALMKS